jgi:hypothetical protein
LQEKFKKKWKTALIEEIPCFLVWSVFEIVGEEVLLLLVLLIVKGVEELEMVGMGGEEEEEG